MTKPLDLLILQFEQSIYELRNEMYNLARTPELMNLVRTMKMNKLLQLAKKWEKNEQ